MGDVGYLVLMVAFVALAMVFVVGCDKIIGPDEAAVSNAGRDDESAPARLSQTKANA
ncbi:MAG TPA: hypothetical protein VLZ05_28275 [Mycobacterium sp.]|jgi:hypothetical protein|nr:hypothetical protein [Mycobacterium sp.]HUH72400.1 hypothetical protein [Mycobacterium sp.]